jgi:hypothetical protein
LKLSEQDVTPATLRGSAHTENRHSIKLKENSMKTTTAVAALLIAFGLAATSAMLLAAPQTVDGTISDSMCGRKHMMPGKSDAECVKACVKAGSAYVLVTDKKIYTLSGNADDLARFAGKHAKVQGDITQDTIKVIKIQ